MPAVAVDWEDVALKAKKEFSQSVMAEPLAYFSADPCGVKIFNLAFTATLTHTPQMFGNQLSYYSDQHFLRFAEKLGIHKYYDYESTFDKQMKKQATKKKERNKFFKQDFPMSMKQKGVTQQKFVEDKNWIMKSGNQSKTQTQRPDGVFEVRFANNTNYVFFESDGDGKSHTNDKYAWDHAKKFMQAIDGCGPRGNENNHAFHVRLNLNKFCFKKDPKSRDADIAMYISKIMFNTTVDCVIDIFQNIQTQSRPSRQRQAFSYWINFWDSNNSVSLQSWQEILTTAGKRKLVEECVSDDLFNEDSMFLSQYYKKPNATIRVRHLNNNSSMPLFRFDYDLPTTKDMNDIIRDKKIERHFLWSSRDLHYLLQDRPKWWVNRYVVCFIDEGELNEDDILDLAPASAANNLITGANSSSESDSSSSSSDDSSGNDGESSGNDSSGNDGESSGNDGEGDEYDVLNDRDIRKLWNSDAAAKENKSTTKCEYFDQLYFRVVDFLINVQQFSLFSSWKSMKIKDVITDVRRKEDFHNFSKFKKAFEHLVISGDHTLVDRTQIKLNNSYYRNMSYRRDSASLSAYLCKGLYDTLPDLDQTLDKYISQYNIPQAALFLRLIRCSSLAVLQELARQYKRGEMSDRLEKLLRQMPVCTESELRWLFEHILTRPIVLLPEPEEDRERGSAAGGEDGDEDNDKGDGNEEISVNLSDLEHAEHGPSENAHEVDDDESRDGTHSEKGEREARLAFTKWKIQQAQNQMTQSLNDVQQMDDVLEQMLIKSKSLTEKLHMQEKQSAEQTKQFETEKQKLQQELKKLKIDYDVLNKTYQTLQKLEKSKFMDDSASSKNGDLSESDDASYSEHESDSGMPKTHLTSRGNDSFENEAKHKEYLKSVSQLLDTMNEDNEDDNHHKIMFDVETACEPDNDAVEGKKWDSCLRDRCSLSMVVAIIVTKKEQVTIVLMHVAKYRNDDEIIKLYRKIAKKIFDVTPPTPRQSRLKNVRLYGFNVHFDMRMLWNFANHGIQKDYNEREINVQEKNKRNMLLDQMFALKSKPHSKTYIPVVFDVKPAGSIKLENVLKNLGYSGKSMDGSEAGSLVWKALGKDNEDETWKKLRDYCAWDTIAIALIMIEDNKLNVSVLSKLKEKVRTSQLSSLTENFQRGGSAASNTNVEKATDSNFDKKKQDILTYYSQTVKSDFSDVVEQKMCQDIICSRLQNCKVLNDKEFIAVVNRYEEYDKSFYCVQYNLVHYYLTVEEVLLNMQNIQSNKERLDFVMKFVNLSQEDKITSARNLQRAYTTVSSFKYWLGVIEPSETRADQTFKIKYLYKQDDVKIQDYKSGKFDLCVTDVLTDISSRSWWFPSEKCREKEDVFSTMNQSKALVNFLWKEQQSDEFTSEGRNSPQGQSRSTSKSKKPKRSKSRSNSQNREENSFSTIRQLVNDDVRILAVEWADRHEFPECWQHKNDIDVQELFHALHQEVNKEHYEDLFAKEREFNELAPKPSAITSIANTDHFLFDVAESEENDWSTEETDDNDKEERQECRGST